jgi:hypothetical protein
MKRVRTIPEITEEGVRILVRELGYADAVRFLATVPPRKGDYTKDRRKYIKDITLEALVERVRAAETTAKPRRTRRKAG